MQTTTTHRFSHDTDTCTCGGQWVYFDDDGTHGCEVAGPWVAAPRNVTGLPETYGVPLDGWGRAACEACGHNRGLGHCDGMGVLCPTCALECPCTSCEGR